MADEQCDFYFGDFPPVRDDELYPRMASDENEAQAGVDKMLSDIHQNARIPNKPEEAGVLEECNWITPTEAQARVHIYEYFQAESRMFHLSVSNVECFRSLYEKEGLHIGRDGCATVLDNATTNGESARCIFYSMMEGTEYKDVFGELFLLCGHAALASIIIPAREYVYNELQKTAGPLITLSGVVEMIYREVNNQFAMHLQADINSNSITWDIVKINRIAKVDTVCGLLLARQFKRLAFQEGSEAFDAEVTMVV
jgi:hypothetical protein